MIFIAFFRITTGGSDPPASRFNIAVVALYGAQREHNADFLLGRHFRVSLLKTDCTS